MVLNIADRIRYLREKNGLTQAALAKKLGITRGSVNFWEMSLTSPSLANVVEMAKIFHVTVDYLLSTEEKMLLDITALDQEQREVVCRLVDCFTNAKK